MMTKAHTSTGAESRPTDMPDGLASTNRRGAWSLEPITNVANHRFDPGQALLDAIEPRGHRHRAVTGRIAGARPAAGQLTCELPVLGFERQTVTHTRCTTTSICPIENGFVR